MLSAYANDVHLLVKILATTVELLENVFKYALMVVVPHKVGQDLLRAVHARWFEELYGWS